MVLPLFPDLIKIPDGNGKASVLQWRERSLAPDLLFLPPGWGSSKRLDLRLGLPSLTLRFPLTQRELLHEERPPPSLPCQSNEVAPFMKRARSRGTDFNIEIGLFRFSFSWMRSPLSGGRTWLIEEVSI